MGDARYAIHYEKVRAAIDRVGEIEQLTDDELVQALGAASRDSDPYLANVLTTAVLNRTRRGRAVTETIGEGVCVIDREGLITFANPAASELLGWTMKELQGTQLHAIAHHHLGPTHDQATDCEFDAALQSRQHRRMDAVFSSRAGRPIEVACTITPLTVNGITESIVILFRDIGERRRVESLLVTQARVLMSAVEKTLVELKERERAERRLAALLAAFPDAVVMTSPLGIITHINEAASRLFGYEAEELIGQPASILLPPSLRKLGAGVDDAGTLLAPSSPEPQPRIELVGCRKDGSEFPIEVRTSVLDEPSGPSVITSIRDVRAREQDPRLDEEGREKAVEARIRAAQEAAERDAAAKTNAIMRSYRELEAFSYSVSHDLQAPLRNLDFLLSTAIQDHEPAGPLAEDLQRMSIEVERLRALVRAVLRLAEVGGKQAERSDCDLSALATSVGEEMQRLFPERQVELRIRPGMRASADTALVGTLLENLLSNAWKYSARRPLAHVEVGQLETQPPTYFVRDDGDGFDMRHAPRIFNPFTRLATASSKEGAGVGLASARRVVEGHGGRIWAESEPGKGATFYFTLEPAERPQ